MRNRHCQGVKIFSWPYQRPCPTGLIPRRQTGNAACKMAKSKTKLDAEARSKQLGHLWWLVDAPLFIDDPLIAKFYDAVVWPQSMQESEIDKSKNETNFEGRGIAGVEGQVLPTFLSGLFGNLKAKGELAASAKAASVAEREVRHVVVMNSERRLHALTATYIETFPERVLHLTLPRGVFSKEPLNSACGGCRQ
jgi:hypothetical protein